MPVSECDRCRVLLKESLYNIYQRQLAFIHTDECILKDCLAHLSHTVRLVKPRSLCTDDGLCLGTACPHYNPEQPACRTPRKELVLDELAVADKEGGVALHDSDLPQSFSNLHHKAGRILLVVAEETLFSCYRQATEDICERTQISVRPQNFTQLKRSLSDQGLPLYEERDRLKDQRNHTISWCSYTLTGRDHFVTFAPSSHKFLVLYLPKQRLSRLHEDDRIIHAQKIGSMSFPFIEALTALRQVFVSTSF